MPFTMLNATGFHGRRPEAVCDACRNRISDAGTATYLYDSDEIRNGATILLACTSECRDALIAEGVRLGVTLKAGGTVQYLVLQMSVNAGVMSEEEARRLWP